MIKQKMKQLKLIKQKTEKKQIDFTNKISC